MNKNYQLKNLTAFSSALAVTALLAACGTPNNASSSSVDNSPSEIAASTVGGAISASDSSGLQALSAQKNTKTFLAQLSDQRTLMPKAWANSLCPTLASGGAACAVSSDTATLTYTACSFFANGPTWNGAQLLTFSTAPSCGSWPSTNSGSLTRTFQTGTTRLASSNISVSIDTTNPSGWSNSVSGGESIVYNNASQRTLTVNGIHLVASYDNGTIWDHSVSSSGLTVNVSGATRTISSGTVTVQHNLAHYVATVSLNNVQFNNSCCTPVSGTISTSFVGGGRSGKTESLSISACGAGTFTDINGNTSNIVMSHCF